MRQVVLAGGIAALAAGAAIAQGTGVKPGLWEITTQITDFGMAGAPPGLAGMMKKPHSMRQCVTPQQAAQGPGDMLKRDGSCKIGHYTLAGGTLDADVTCRGMHMVEHGSFTPTSFTVQSHAEDGGNGGMTMASTITARLVGSC